MRCREPLAMSYFTLRSKAHSSQRNMRRSQGVSGMIPPLCLLPTACPWRLCSGFRRLHGLSRAAVRETRIC